METTTLADLATEVRLYADERVTGYLSDTTSSLYAIVNNEIRRRRNFVLENGGAAFYRTSSTFALTSGTADYSLGSGSTIGNAQEVCEVSLWWGDDQLEEVEQSDEWEARRIDADQVWGQDSPKCFSVGANASGVVLTLTPTPTTVTSCQVSFIPTFTALSSSASSVSGPEGFRDAVVLGSAIQVISMQKEPEAQGHIALLREQLSETLAQLRTACRNLTRNFSQRVRDVNPDIAWRNRNTFRLPAA